MSADLLPAIVGTALVVGLLAVGAIRLAAAYRRVRRTARRWARTRLVLTQTARRRKGSRRG